MKVPLILATGAVVGALPMILGTSGAITLAADRYVPPKECQSWYDGCNMCEEGEHGLVCTSRQCENYGKGFCRQVAGAEEEGGDLADASDTTR